MTNGMKLEIPADEREAFIRGAWLGMLFTAGLYSDNPNASAEYDRHTAPEHRTKLRLSPIADARRTECERETASGRCGEAATHVLFRSGRTYLGDTFGASEAACERHCHVSAEYLTKRGVPSTIARNPYAPGVCLACSGPCEPGTSLCPCAEPVDA